MTPDPKLVEVLAYYADPNPCPDHPHADHPDACQRENARRWLARHRIVQLPEEPDGWQFVRHSGDWCIGEYPKETAIRETHGFIRPVYIIPGDPQEVEP